MDVMMSLGYLKKSFCQDERQKLEIIYSLLSQNNTQIDTKNLLTFIIASHGILIDQQDTLDHEETVLLKASKFGIINSQGQYVISEEQMKDIKHNY